MRLVLDTKTLIMFLEGDERVSRILEMISSGHEAYTTPLNIAELIRIISSRLGLREAKGLAEIVANSRELTIPSIDPEMAIRIGEIMASYGDTITLSEAAALALAERVNGTLVTANKTLDKVGGVRKIIIS